MKLTWIKENRAYKLTYTAEAENIKTLFQIFDQIEKLESDNSNINKPDTPVPKAPTYSRIFQFGISKRRKL